MDFIILNELCENLNLRCVFKSKQKQKLFPEIKTLIKRKIFNTDTFYDLFY